MLPASPAGPASQHQRPLAVDQACLASHRGDPGHKLDAGAADILGGGVPLVVKPAGDGRGRGGAWGREGIRAWGSEGSRAWGRAWAWAGHGVGGQLASAGGRRPPACPGQAARDLPAKEDCKLQATRATRATRVELRVELRASHGVVKLAADITPPGFVVLPHPQPGGVLHL